MTGEEKLRRLQKALDLAGPTHRLTDVVERIKDHRAQIWEHGDGCIVTELHEYPLAKAVHYWLVSGVLKDCLALEHDINTWANEQGCTLATACGRRGWGRALEPLGWGERPGHVNFYKRLVS
jgi:predicted glycosyltransferase